MQGKRKQGFGNVKGNILLTVISVLFCICVVFIAVLLWNQTPSAVPVLKRISTSLGKPISSQTSQQASSTPAASSDTSSSSSSSSQAATKVVNNAAKDLESALFIGDFYTNGLSLYGGIDSKITYTNNNLSAGNILTKEVTFRDKKTNVDEAAKDLAPKGIFIMLGSNDLAKGISAENFSTNMGKLVDKLKEDSPNSHIYIQSVFPVTEAYSKKSKSHNNDNVNAYNEALKTLCTEKNVVYLDVSAAVSDGSGALPAKSSSDGYHLKPVVYSDWVTYIKNQK